MGAACLFFGVVYRYHLHYQEQYQLFLFTSEYAWETFAVPGGLADYIGRFFTQFFYYAWAGAVILAVMLGGVQVLTWKALCRHGALGYVWSFMPAVLLWCYMCDENAMLAAGVAILISQGAALLTHRIASDRVRRLLTLLLVPLLYMAVGSLALLFVLWRACEERRVPKGWWIFLGILCVVFVLCPLIAHQLFSWPLKSLVVGLHYFRFPQVIPVWPWLALVVVVFPMFLPAWPERWRKGFRWAVAGSVLVLFPLSVWLLSMSRSSTKEEVMKYDYMVRMRMWNRTMMAADARTPMNPLTVTCLNLALAQSGRMADHQFDYFQNGTEGLLPLFIRDFVLPLTTAEVYYHLGMVNTAQRFTFEAQEAIPDYQKSARCYKRLAETNLINGDYAVARKYLKALQHTLFYREWANQTLPLLGQEEAVNAHPEYGQLRKLRLREDFLFSDTEMDSMLGLLFQNGNCNRLAFEYLMSWTLLRKDLSRFAECYPLGRYLNYDHIPRSYQEALLLFWSQHHQGVEGMPWPVSPEVIRQLQEFLRDSMSKRSGEYMAAAYGHTYWYYYFYRK